MTARKPVLVVLHQERSTAGRVGQMLMRRGFPLDIRRPPLGDTLPDTLEHHAGAVVFGGPMSANDGDEYVHREIDWIDVPLRENKPFFGICLGAQMLSRHLGGKVQTAPCGRVEIGWYPLHSTPEGEDVLHGWPKHVYHFHREGFDLPSGAVRLATADIYENQAFRYGDNAWGVQFHGELTRAMMQRWVVHGAHRFTLPNAQPGRQHLEGRMLWDAPLRNWMERFLTLIFERDAA